MSVCWSARLFFETIVAAHTSALHGDTCAAVIMQLHAGWIAFIQTRVLNCLGCLWFNRNEVGLRVMREARRYYYYYCACTSAQVLTVRAVL